MLIDSLWVSYKILSEFTASKFYDTDWFLMGEFYNTDYWFHTGKL